MTDQNNHIVENPDGTTSVMLDHALKSGAKEIEQINFIHPDDITISHLEALDLAKGDVGATIVMISELSDVSRGTAKKIRVPNGDMKRVSEFAGTLLGNE